MKVINTYVVKGSAIKKIYPNMEIHSDWTYEILEGQESAFIRSDKRLELIDRGNVVKLNNG
jgi:hypothetical protein